MLSMFVAMRRKSCIFPAKFAENNNRIIRTITGWFLLSKKKSVSFTLFFVPLYNNTHHPPLSYQIKSQYVIRSISTVGTTECPEEHQL